MLRNKPDQIRKAYLSAVIDRMRSSPDGEADIWACVARLIDLKIEKGLISERHLVRWTYLISLETAKAFKA